MTANRDFKQVVRDRMAQTGLNYTAARAQLLAEQDALAQQARAEHERVVGRFFDGPRLRSIPTKRKVRVSILLELLRRFEAGRTYTELEVNDLLRAAHDDVATLRRELVDYGYLEREAGVYRLPDRVPERSDNVAQEISDWEAVWLPGHLAGRPDA